MAPLTRCRADVDHNPTSLMAEYYAQRASAGLIIAEATMAMAGNSSFWMEPGIYSESQIAGWKVVTDAVHDQGGQIVLQIWHGGRACHPLLNDGAQPVAPSSVPITAGEVQTPQGKVPYVVPRELASVEIPVIVEGFKMAAQNAKIAGFDGVEVHGANGYLLDQFLRDGSNLRTDNYGGTIENRARLLLEVVAAAVSVWGEGRVGLRISPLNSYNSMVDTDPLFLTSWLATKLNDCQLAYLHVMRGDFFQQQTGDVMKVARSAFRGVLIGNMGYNVEEAEESIASGQVDAVAFGTSFLANPDLPKRFLAKSELNLPDASRFYSPGPAGYTDYPTLGCSS
jgi:N-ethylmaleimide reductase